MAQNSRGLDDTSQGHGDGAEHNAQAQELEHRVNNDEYFISRNLYPNVDFYSGIIMKAIGIPIEMFPVMFSIGRLPGWIAQWKESMDDPQWRISRPRQIYTGPTESHYIPIKER